MYRDIIRPEKLDRSVSLHGADYIDVPAQGRRDYKLHFHSYKEFSIVAKVHTDTLCTYAFSALLLTPKLFSLSSLLR